VTTGASLLAGALPNAGALSAQLKGKLIRSFKALARGLGAFMRDTSGDDGWAPPVSARTGAISAMILAAGLLLAACSSGSDSSFSLFAEPGKYQYYSCDQIAGEIKSWSRREQELKTLMDRADQSAGGAAVGLIAYKADYVAAGEELDLLKATAHSKKCDQAASWRSDAVIQ
jgi:hypothetical protein